ncbi:virion core protein, T7 gp14 family [Ruegeria arenilitoris]|uniref:virion core protein, T7 gp14 family n=1 Tax=Ruegeria arenilitoris TaxID=1173585 RepID=UPI003C7C8F19
MSLPLILPALQAAVTAISTAAPAITAGLSVISAASAYGQASAQAKAQEITNENMEKIARTDMQDGVDQLNMREQQEIEAATEQQLDHQNAATRAIASAKVGASAGGVTGFSVDALLGDLYGQHATNKDRINMNLENTTDQLQAEREALGTNYTRTVASLPTPQKPSAIGYGLQAGLGVMDAYKDKFKVLAEKHQTNTTTTNT